MRFQNISSCDVNNGEGVRVTLWVQGCSHHCPGCHNSKSWDFTGGREFTEEDKAYLFNELDKPYIQGITFCGGEPLDSYDDVIQLIDEIRVKLPEKDIWLYTGYTKEQLEQSDKKDVLKKIDVMVDGEFKIEQRDITLPFRGSRNQRIFKFVNR